MCEMIKYNKAIVIKDFNDITRSVTINVIKNHQGSGVAASKHPLLSRTPVTQKYTLERCYSRYCSSHLAIHVLVPSPPKQSHAKRHQRKQSIHTGRYSCIILSKTKTFVWTIRKNETTTQTFQ